MPPSTAKVNSSNPTDNSAFADSQVLGQFSLRIQSSAERKGWKQADLARASDVPAGRVSEYWHGQKLPSANYLFAIARALSVSAEWLATGRGSEKASQLVAAEDADWVELPEYAMMEFNETGRMAPIATALVRRDWLQSSLGESSGLWIARLQAPYEALALHRGEPIICTDHRAGERMIDGTHYLFWVNGGIVMAPFARREDNAPDRAVFARNIGIEEDQYQPVARVVGVLARPI